MQTPESSPRTIYIGGLSPLLTAPELTKRFESFGSILNINLPFPKTHTSRFAFITLQLTDASLSKLINVYNRTKWNGLVLTVAERTGVDQIEKLRRERLTLEDKLKNTSIESEALILSKRKMKRKAVQMMAADDCAGDRVGNGWVKVGDRCVVQVKMRNSKGRVVKFDAGKFKNMHLTCFPYHVDSIEPPETFYKPIERSAVQIERQRKRGGIFTPQEIKVSRKCEKLIKDTREKLEKLSKRSGKSVSFIVADAERELALVNERQHIREIAATFKRAPISGVVEFTDSELDSTGEGVGQIAMFDSDSDQDIFTSHSHIISRPLMTVDELFGSDDDE